GVVRDVSAVDLVGQPPGPAAAGERDGLDRLRGRRAVRRRQLGGLAAPRRLTRLSRESARLKQPPPFWIPVSMIPNGAADSVQATAQDRAWADPDSAGLASGRPARRLTRYLPNNG